VDGQVAGDCGDVAGSGVGGLDRSEELLVAELLRDGGYGDRDAVLDTQAAVDPGLLRSLA
jgi:hypothetical protein